MKRKLPDMTVVLLILFLGFAAALMIFLAGCAHSIPPLPEDSYKTYTLLHINKDPEDYCVTQTFTITNEYIGFEQDATFVPLHKCNDITGFPLTTWNRLDKFFKAIYDTHDIPRIDVTRTKLKEGTMPKRMKTKMKKKKTMKKKGMKY